MNQECRMVEVISIDPSEEESPSDADGGQPNWASSLLGLGEKRTRVITTKGAGLVAILSRP